MKPANELKHRAAVVLASLCTGLLIGAMVTLPICKEQVFLDQNTISSGGETLILIGFALVPIFNIVSLAWVATEALRFRGFRVTDPGIIALGIACLILLMGEKVMADEIGREYALGWEVVGEWIILYVCFTVQLLYNLMIFRRLHPGRNDQHSEVIA